MFGDVLSGLGEEGYKVWIKIHLLCTQLYTNLKVSNYKLPNYSRKLHSRKMVSSIINGSEICFFSVKVHPATLYAGVLIMGSWRNMGNPGIKYKFC